MSRESAFKMWVASILIGSTFVCPISHATTYPVPFPYPTIQVGIDAASFGDTVLVAPGTYTDTEIRFISGLGTARAVAFLKDGVIVVAAGGPSVTKLAFESGIGGVIETCVLARGLRSSSTVFWGFSCDVSGKSGVSCGDNGHVAIVNCVFKKPEFVSMNGIGMFGHGNVSVVDCDFENCTSSTAGAIWATSGHFELIRCNFRSCTNGAVYINQGDPEGQYVTSALVEDCSFVDNYCAPGEGGGGGLVISVAVGGSIVRGCYFENNFDDNSSHPGALGVGPIGSCLVEKCVFVNNGTDGFGGAIGGGTVPFMIRNNTFVDNYRPLSAVGGSAIAIYSSGPGTHLENNVIVDSGGAPAIGSFAPGLVATCNVFWNNVAGVGIPLSATDRIVDPLFCNPDAGDFSLEANSPCLPPFSLGCGLIGAFPQGCGTVSVESKSWGEIKGMYR